MDLQQIATIIFILVLTIILYANRKKLKIQGAFPILYFLMWRTKLGLKSMDVFANKFRKTIQYVAYSGIVVGFLGMIFLSYILIKGLFVLFTKPESAESIKLVLPFEAGGAAIAVPFFYWIISLFIIAVIHEFSHGFVARSFNLKVKSSGFAFLSLFLPIVPAAFVEPDEKQLKKAPLHHQLSVFAAGPFSNILLGTLMGLLFIFAMLPLSSIAFQSTNEGVVIDKFTEDSVSAKYLEVGEIITKINSEEVKNVKDFIVSLNKTNPGETIVVSVKDKDNKVRIEDMALAIHPNDESKAYMGIFVDDITEVSTTFKNNLGFFAKPFAYTILWLTGLVFWLYLLNLGIGLFNLLPMGPIDGGQMLNATLSRYWPKHARKIWKYVGLLFLAIILFQIFFPLLNKAYTYFATLL